MPIRSRDKLHASPRPTPMSSSPLTALSPVDGRYQDRVNELREFFTELGLIRLRVRVEIRWLEALASEPLIPELPPLSGETAAALERVVSGFSEADGARVKAIESETNHDVKAVEYFLREKLPAGPQTDVLTGFIHFACTSE